MTETLRNSFVEHVSLQLHRATLAMGSTGSETEPTTTTARSLSLSPASVVAFHLIHLCSFFLPISLFAEIISSRLNSALTATHPPTTHHHTVRWHSPQRITASPLNNKYFPKIVRNHSTLNRTDKSMMDGRVIATTSGTVIDDEMPGQAIPSHRPRTATIPSGQQRTTLAPTTNRTVPIAQKHLVLSRVLSLHQSPSTNSQAPILNHIQYDSNRHHHRDHR